MTNPADYNREPRDVLHLEIVDDGVERPYAQKQKVRNRQSKRENAEIYYCADCGGKTTTTGIAYHDTDYDRTDCHHLIKERYLAENTRTSYHESNLVALDPTCHAYWESWEKGRPHIMSWLFRSVTGQETELAYTPYRKSCGEHKSILWSDAEQECLQKKGTSCTICGHERGEATYHIPGSRLAQYRGPDVRAVHILPPIFVPELIHDQRNLVPMCFECLLGSKTTDAKGWKDGKGWRDAPVTAWIEEFAPELERFMIE